MGRPKKAIRPIEKNISLPEDICARVDLMLYSELEQRVPHGAWSRYITELIRKDLTKEVKILGKHAEGIIMDELY